VETPSSDNTGVNNGEINKTVGVSGNDHFKITNPTGIRGTGVIYLDF